MNNLLSILFGLSAWGILGVALLSGKHCVGAMAAGGGLCTAALYLQIREYEHLILLGDRAALEDICHGETVAATVLVAVTLLLCLLGCCLPKAGREHR